MRILSLTVLFYAMLLPPQWSGDVYQGYNEPISSQWDGEYYNYGETSSVREVEFDPTDPDNYETPQEYCEAIGFATDFCCENSKGTWKPYFEPNTWEAYD
jgi:hypothetical protein